MNTAEFKHFKLHSDSTLNAMTKADLISYIHMLYRNWDACDELLFNVIQYAKLLDRALDKACIKLQDDTQDECDCPGEQFGFIPACCDETFCDGSNKECWREWCMSEHGGENL